MLKDVLTKEAATIIDQADITIQLDPEAVFAQIEEMIFLEPDEEELVLEKINQEIDNPDFIIGILLIATTILVVNDENGIPENQIINALLNPEQYIGVLNNTEILKKVIEYLKKKDDTIGTFERFIGEIGRKIQEAGKRLDKEINRKLKEESMRVDSLMNNVNENINKIENRIVTTDERLIDLEKKMMTRFKEVMMKTEEEKNKNKKDKNLEIYEYIILICLIFSFTSLSIHLTIANPLTSKIVAFISLIVAVCSIAWIRTKKIK